MSLLKGITPVIGDVWLGLGGCKKAGVWPGPPGRTIARGIQFKSVLGLGAEPKSRVAVPNLGPELQNQILRGHVRLRGAATRAVPDIRYLTLSGSFSAIRWYSFFKFIHNYYQ